MATEYPQTAASAALQPPSLLRHDDSMYRTSRFFEPPMQEFTAANSLYEDDITNTIDSAKFRTLLRVVNAILHLIACLLLLSVMALFLDHERRRHKWATETEYDQIHFTLPQAVTLVILLATDTLLDLFTLVQPRRSHPGWLIIVRLALGVSYLAIFMAYIGIGDVFHGRFSFWALPPGYAGPVVYIFLWVIGVWNLVNMAIHHRKFGADMKKSNMNRLCRFFHVHRQPTSWTAADSRNIIYQVSQQHELNSHHAQRRPAHDDSKARKSAPAPGGDTTIGRIDGPTVPTIARLSSSAKSVEGAGHPVKHAQE